MLHAAPRSSLEPVHGTRAYGIWAWACVWLRMHTVSVYWWSRLCYPINITVIFKALSRLWVFLRPRMGMAMVMVMVSEELVGAVAIIH